MTIFIQISLLLKYMKYLWNNIQYEVSTSLFKIILRQIGFSDHDIECDLTHKWQKGIKIDYHAWFYG